ncbi:MAG: flagellar hook-associated protein FlgK [Bdellovibrionaceae bacterium]|nr:flagellar hook-associated protein FlgK [Pseudobdellovibrionaceae bacterium]
MSKISSMMDVGKRSLSNSQTALQTVSHNIANKNTEGYSRQRVDQVANDPTGVGRIRIGTGARATQVSRINNPWLEKQIQKENMNLGFTESKANSLARVEQIYNEQANKGLNQFMTDFFNSFRELAITPESLASRTMVKEAANALTQDFKRVNGQLKEVQNDLDGQIKTTVEEINQITKEIASLNEKIQQVEIQNVPANDERDRRDLLLKKLGEKVDITWAESKEGMVSVTAGNTAILVSGLSSRDLETSYTDERDRLEIFYRSTENGSLFNITGQIKGGRIGGALEIRDQLIEQHLSSIDNMAYELAKEVNKAHIEGFDNYGKDGILFFEMPSEVKGAAETLSLNESIKLDAGKIAVAARTNSPGDNTIANIISGLQFQRVMDNGNSTLDDYYTAQVGQIGTIAQRSMKTHENQKNILDQLTQIRESISGVSLDEEAAKMVEMQKAYDASARLIRTADEMFDTILNLKRL